MKQLERDLGLGAVVAISIGAMIGSGIFILPALALEIAGPAVIFAYLLAGLLVVPAALSKSEMATAMPEAGGTYIFIERGMGPLLGTIAGVGTWFSLSFKSALALVGGVPYLVLLFDLPVKPVAIGLAAFLVVVNLLGAKQTGRLQVAIVVVMLAALGWFVAGSAGSVEGGNYDPFLIGGLEGLLAATGLVFVSYAGVTKVASVAEEVEDPGRNIPLGILGSLAVTTLLYVAIVAVMVGVTDAGTVAGSATPVAVAAEATLGNAGVLAVIGAAILALVSTANAGILSSSRYPFAMSRDDLVPPSLAAVSDRFGTPTSAITLTGVVVLVLIAFVPILEIAKLASAFQILVFVLVNVAVVAFREGAVDYDPVFESPLYPWVQAVGVVGGLALLTQMGLVALAGAVLITLASVVWYLVYVRPRVDREGVATDVIRRRLGRESLADTRRTLAADESSGFLAGAATAAGDATTADDGPTAGDATADRRRSDSESATTTLESDTREVLVALTREYDLERERSLLRLASDLVGESDGRIVVVRFDEVHDQVPLDYAAETQSPADVAFEERTHELAGELDVAVDYGEVVSHDTKHAIVNVADHRESDAILAEHERLRLRSRLLADPIDWVVRHAPCTVLLVENRGYDRPSRIALSADGAPYDPQTAAVAADLARSTGAEVVLEFEGEERQSSARTETIDRYQETLATQFPEEVRTSHVAGEDVETNPDLLVRYGRTHRLDGRSRDGAPPATDCTEVTVYPYDADRVGLPRRLLERVAF